jgi:hypothetical protein
MQNQDNYDNVAFYSPNPQDNIQLQSLRIEPDKQINIEFVTRNLQLGNITRSEYQKMVPKLDFVMFLENYPYDEGGWLMSDLVRERRQQIDAQLVTSLSVDAVGRRSLATVERSQRIEENPKSGPWFWPFGKRR